jgi:hypothetical protein
MTQAGFNRLALPCSCCALLGFRVSYISTWSSAVFWFCELEITSSRRVLVPLVQIPAAGAAPVPAAIAALLSRSLQQLFMYYSSNTTELSSSIQLSGNLGAYSCSTHRSSSLTGPQSLLVACRLLGGSPSADQALLAPRCCREHAAAPPAPRALRHCSPCLLVFLRWRACRSVKGLHHY